MDIFAALKGPEHDPYLLEGGKPAALLVHGFPGTPIETRPLAEALHADGWTAQGLLLPGMGREMDTLFTRRHTEWRAAVFAALAALRRDHAPVLLIGHSMGGGLAIQATAEMLPDGLVLAAPFWRLPQVHPALLTLWPVLRLIFRTVRPFKQIDFTSPDLRGGVAGFLPELDLDDPAVQATIRDFAMPTEIIAQLALVGRAAYRCALQARVSTLVLQGMADDVVLPANTRRLLQRLPGPLSYHEFDAPHVLLSPGNAAWPRICEQVLAFAERMLRA